MIIIYSQENCNSKCSFLVSSVMDCPWTSQHMTPSTAIEGSKTFSLAHNLKPLVKLSVREVH